MESDLGKTGGWGAVPVGENNPTEEFQCRWQSIPLSAVNLWTCVFKASANGKIYGVYLSWRVFVARDD